MGGHLVVQTVDRLVDQMEGPMEGRLVDQMEGPMEGRLVDQMEGPMVGRLENRLVGLSVAGTKGVVAQAWPERSGALLP
jgi:hypothetical protein